MVLASQSPRLSPRGRFNTNVGGRRPAVRWLLVSLTLVVLLAGGWWLGRSLLAGGDEAVGETPPSPKPVAEAVVIIETPGKSSELPKEMATAPAIDTKPAPPPPPIADGGLIGDAPEPSQPAAAIPDTGASRAALDGAIAMVDQDPLKARAALTRLLEGSALSTVDRMRGYDAVNKVNGSLLFSPRVQTGDPYCVTYKVQPGDSLEKIARSQKLDCDWRLLQRVNGLANPNALQVGKSLKLPRGVFHGEVRKAEYRLNVYAGEGPDRVMVASYPIGLGESNTTPTGAFVVRPKSKLVNPEWRNPRTGEFFANDDPKNPIGERWVGLKGVEPHNKGFEGYGIHGTIDLDSIGQQRSMGCVRMRPGDVEVVYELFTEPNSTVTIAP